MGVRRSTRAGAIAAIVGLLGIAAADTPARASGVESEPPTQPVADASSGDPATHTNAPPAPAAPTSTSTDGAPAGDTEASVAVEPRPLRVRGPRGDRSAETWDFAIAFENGERLFLQFAITNIGPGDRNAAAMWHWVDADGGVVTYDNGQRASGWSLESDARVIRIKSSVLDLRRPALRLTMDKKRAKIDLRIALPPGPLHEAAEDGDEFALWATHAPAEGTYWTRGMESARPVRGTASLVYSWLADERRERRRVELLSLDSNLDLYVIAILRDSGHQDSWAILRPRDDAPILSGEVALCPGNDGKFIWPARLRVDGDLRATARIDAPFLRSDPVAALPRPVATLVRLVYEPRRLWSTAAIDAEGIAPSAAAAVRTSFGNPLSRSARNALGRDPRCRGERP